MIRRGMRARRLAALLAGSGLAFGACEAKDPVILRLEGETVRRSDFERHLSGVTRGLGPVDPAARRGILEAFLEQRALVIEARRRGHLPPGAGPEAEPRAVARLLADATRPPAVSEDEIAAFYRDHEPELAVPETVTLRQIVVGTLNEARDVRRRLARNPRAFEVIARSQSKGEEAGAGGYMGTFERGQLPPELEAAAFALAEGATSEPVETGLGYHVLRVESRQQARAPTLDEARETIRARLARDRRAQAERAFVAEVLARAKVNHEAALRPTPPS
jgi:parvulin-like peptidyl-prolyl isomerase